MKDVFCGGGFGSMLQLTPLFQFRMQLGTIVIPMHKSLKSSLELRKRTSSVSLALLTDILDYSFSNANGPNVLYQFHALSANSNCTLRALTLPSNVQPYHAAYLLEELWSVPFQQSLGISTAYTNPILYPFFLGIQNPQEDNRSLA